jgi:preprotein translocase subunit SecE
VSEDGPSVRTMIAVVAVVVAAVILLFFAVGYLLGKILL